MIKGMIRVMAYIRAYIRAWTWACLGACLGAGLWLGALLAGPGHAQAPAAGKPILLDATLAADGQSITLTWQNAIPMRARDIQVSRRVLGASGVETWTELGVLAGRFIKASDSTIQPGIAYEYRVLRNHGDFFSAGYWVAGRDVPAPQDHGTVFVAVEESLQDALAPRLARLRDDLMGAGWQVRLLPTPRHVANRPLKTLEQARALKAELRRAVAAQPKGLRHALLLLGHVPLVTSGTVAPDGHTPGPHATDLFYGDLSGTWRDDGAGVLVHSRLPDGDIELPVGRVDFAQIAEGVRALELAHLRAYLDKAHHWRHGLLGDLRTAYAQSGHLLVEQADLHNILGADAIARGGHHDAGEAQPWLWGVDFGRAGGRRYPEYAMKPVFAINFGSHKQKIDRPHNALIGTLAQPFYTVAAAWGGRPAWRLHQMGLGRTIGQAQMITVNNGGLSGAYPEAMDYLPTGSYPWRAPIWANLLGDPTLAAFPLTPPHGLQATSQGADVVLSWQGGAARHLLLRAPAQGEFVPLGTVTGETRFVDTNAPPGARYQLRALGRQEVYAGSFLTASQGVFADVDTAPPPPPDISQTVTGPGPHKLQLEGTGPLLAPLRPPRVGQLKLLAGGWHYLPEDGFEGVVEIALSASGTGETVVGRLRLDITALPTASTETPD